MAGVCRVCIVKAVKYTPLSDKIEASSNLSFLDFLNKCTNLNASASDKLPQSLCSICASSLKKFYSFVKLAEKSNVILRETWKSLLATGRSNNGRISYGKVAIITNERNEEDSDEFNNDEYFHCQPSINPTGSSQHILNIEKEEPRVSGSTSTVQLKNVEINDSDKSNSNIDQPGSIAEFLSARRLVRIDGEPIDFEVNIPISLLERRLAQVEDGTNRNPSNKRKKTGRTRSKCKEATLVEAPGPPDIACSGGLLDNKEIACDEIAVKNEKIVEESEVFRKENSIHWQTNENSSGSSLYIMDIEKEEVCLSDGTAIVDSKDPEIQEKEASKSNLDQPENSSGSPLYIMDIEKEEVCLSDGTAIVDSKDPEIQEKETSKSNLDQPEEPIQESEDMLSYIDDYLTNIFAERSDSNDNAPSPLAKRELNKNKKVIDLQSDDDHQTPCIPSNVKKKTSESSVASTVSEAVITRRKRSRPLTITTEVERKCKCTLCGKTFNFASSRLKHMESHGYFYLGSRKKCDQCGKEFKNGDILKRHMKSHKTRSSVKYAGKYLL